MSEIQVGEYVRTEDGKLGRITKVVTETIFYVQFYDNLEWKTDLEECPIKKHSFKIKDVLKKGDLIYTDCGLVWYDYTDGDTIVVYNGKAYINIDEREIYKIYTKEMMETITYKVKENIIKYIPKK